MRPKSRFYFEATNGIFEGYFVLNEYSLNHRMAITLYFYDESIEEYREFATITRNLIFASYTDTNCVFIDTDICPFGLHLLVERLKCAYPTRHFAREGNKWYQEVKLSISKLLEYVYFIGGYGNDKNTY